MDATSALRRLDRRVRGRLFGAGLAACAPLARVSSERPSRMAMRVLARLTVAVRRGGYQFGLDNVVREWQRMFPSPKMVPITRVAGNTCYAQVRARCPLRGTGDVRACYRLMEYDRAMLRDIGGQLVVLKSQAEAGVEVCEVAIRALGESTGDLIPAHARAAD